MVPGEEIRILVVMNSIFISISYSIYQTSLRQSSVELEISKYRTMANCLTLFDLRWMAKLPLLLFNRAPCTMLSNDVELRLKYERARVFPR